MYDKRIEVLFIIGMAIGILALVFMFLDWLSPDSTVVVQLAAESPITVQVPTDISSQWESGIYIDNNECFVRIQSGDTVPLYNYFDNRYRLKLIIDDEVYWIRLEVD
jgi:hypothetical protein